MTKAFVALPVIVFMLIASLGVHLNIGLRHVLPVYPFLYLMIGGFGNVVSRIKFRAVRYAMSAVTACAVLGTASFNLAWAPHYLAYFNEFVGSAESGAKMVLDSNLNWGQDNRPLAEWAKSKSIEHIFIGASRTNPELYESFRLKWTFIAPEDMARPKPGTYALDIGFYLRRRGEADSWFDGRRPERVIGKTYYVFFVK